MHNSYSGREWTTTFIVIVTVFIIIARRTRQHAKPAAADVQRQGHLREAQHIVQEAVRHQRGQPQQQDHLQHVLSHRIAMLASFNKSVPTGVHNFLVSFPG